MEEVTTQDQGQPTGEESAPDPLANFKAETGRKLGNFEQKFGAVEQQLQSIQEMLKASRSQPAAAADDAEDDSELLYQNPKLYKQKLESRIEQKVEAKVERKLEERSRAETERLQTLASLAAEYPELNKAESALYQETVKVLNSLSPEKRATGEGYQLAVLRAAANLGEKPVHKRGKAPEQDADNFSFSGKSNNPPKKKSSKDDIDPKTLAWAELLKVDLSKEEDIEEVKKYAKRDYRRPE